MSTDHDNQSFDATAVISHMQKLLFAPKPPPMPEVLSENADIQIIHDYVTKLRQQLDEYSKGDFSQDIHLRGATAGLLKSLQANMLHLIWQMRQVERGDFSQRVDFMGEFADAFNKMVVRLNNALTALKKKEDELMSLASELEREVENRGAALAALQKSEESFKYLAEHDPLTGLLNRRSFSAQAEMQLARDSIMGHPCCLALMDVDHFKLFNDTHGHPNGDLALKHVATIGNSTLRKDDRMGRYGGEEFIFLFPKAGPTQGFNAADRIRQLIADRPVKLADGEVSVTASFGIVSIPPGLAAKTSINILEFSTGLADTALYRAKSAGRNKVVPIEFPDNIDNFTSCPFTPETVTAAQG